MKSRHLVFRWMKGEREWYAGKGVWGPTLYDAVPLRRWQAAAVVGLQWLAKMQAGTLEVLV